MERKYRTTHYGVAAYLVGKNFEIERIEQGTNREGQERTFIEINTDIATGKKAAEDFFNGNAISDLKRFYDNLGIVKRKVYEVRN